MNRPNETLEPGDPPSSRSVAADIRHRMHDRERLFVLFFFAVYFYLVYELLRILAPFFAPLLSAVMVALVVYPLHQLVSRWIRRPTAAAGLTTFAAVATLVVPFMSVIWLLVSESNSAVPALRDWLAAQPQLDPALLPGHLPPPVDAIWKVVTRYAEAIDLDLKSVALEAARAIGNYATSAGAGIVRSFFVILFQLVIFLFALFFFLRDGPWIIARFLDLVPMENASKALVLESLDRTLVAMVRGTVITASAQGAMTGIGLAIFGAPFPVLLGFTAAFLAVVPVVGAALVWIPATLYLLLTDQPLAALGLTVWGLTIVALIDNVLRPIVVGEQSKLPITLLFLGVLGGIQLYGLVGGLIAPMLIASVFAFARIYREQYLARPST